MSEPVLRAATSLAGVLGRENTALRAMDLSAAIALLAEKTQALAALDAALAVGDAALPAARSVTEASLTEASLTEASLTEALARDLPTLVADNRRLLETALHVQTRLIGLIAHAAAQQARQATPRYGPCGGLAPTRPSAIAVSARA